MLTQDKSDKLISIFVDFDDLVQLVHCQMLPSQRAAFGFSSRMSISEIASILIFYHHSEYKNFQYYYHSMVELELRHYFPCLLSYKRFLRLIEHVLPYMLAFRHWQCRQSELTQLYFIDSKRLPVCHNRRIASHRVFRGIAQRGKSSTGFFYGFKVHLIINNLGQIMQFAFTPANVADNNHDLLRQLSQGIKGRCYGDKGYVSSIFEELFQKGFRLVAKLRDNMKNKLCEIQDRYGMAKRGLIESVNDLLMTICDIEHTRHRKPENAFTHMAAALVAYGYLDRKPKVQFSLNE
ncbi:MAG: IS982 family transposase [Bacteroidota bacterium]